MILRHLRVLPALLIAVLLSACATTGDSATPEPTYESVRTDGAFEVRDYPELVIVSTPMGAGTNGAFGKLFNYISGENEGSREIAMTAPVIQAQEGQKIAMTAPVLQTSAAGSGTQSMIFVLPEDFTLETAPVPTDPAVTLSTIAPRRVATVQFSGRMTDAALAEQTAFLQGWMAQNGLSPIGPAESAGYDAPWVLPPFRRNEVLIPITMQ